MAELAAEGNLARVIAAQERLYSAAERTGQSLQRMERYFGKAAEAGNRLSQITARPAIVMRDYFSFAIDRLLLQLADISQMKVEVKLIVNAQVIDTVKQLKQLLQGLGGTMNVKIQGPGASTNASTSVDMSSETSQVINNVQNTQTNNAGGNKGGWIGSFVEIASGIKTLGEAFKSFGEGFKGFGEGFKSFTSGWTDIVGSITTLKDIFGKGKKPDILPSKGKKTDPKMNEKTNSKVNEKTKPPSVGKTDPKTKEKTDPKTSTVLDSTPKEVTEPSVPANGSKSGKFKNILNAGKNVIKWGGKLASKAAAPLGAAMAVADIYTAENKKEAAVKASSSLAGSVIGGAIGTAILPGVGTVLGGMIGGLAGDAFGGFLSGKIFGKKKVPEKAADTALVPSDSQSIAAAPPNTSASPPTNAANSLNSSNYNINVNGVTVNFPTEELDEDALALRIGQQIVSEMNAVMPNQA
jgi:hypothetical protein